MLVWRPLEAERLFKSLVHMAAVASALQVQNENNFDSFEDFNNNNENTQMDGLEDLNSKSLKEALERYIYLLI